MSIKDQPLYIRFRPTSFKSVLGHETVIKALSGVLKKPDRPHAYLLTGPSGVGKTTIARIIGKELKIDLKNIMEIDAASHGGVESMRQVTKQVQYKAFGDSASRLIIVDECHALSTQTWQSLLKAIEEPPEHVYWAFCTTEDTKVPRTIKTRCFSVQLKALSQSDLQDLLTDIVVATESRIEEPVIRKCCKAANGSARQALQNLMAVKELSPGDKLVGVIGEADDEKTILDLIRALLFNRAITWQKLAKQLKAMEETPPETFRRIVLNYCMKCLLDAKSDGEALKFLSVMETFEEQFSGTDAKPLLVMRLAGLFFQDEDS